MLLDDFTVDPVPVTEEAPRALSVEDALEVITRKKAIAASRKHPGVLVLGADTVVAYRGQLVGKADTENQVRTRLAMLADETHQVVTGIAIARNGAHIDAASVATEVRFARMPPDVVDAYVASGQWEGKAGGYGLQDPLLAPHIRIDGPWSNVVGLPLAETARLLRDNDIACRDPPDESWLRDHNPFDSSSR